MKDCLRANSSSLKTGSRLLRLAFAGLCMAAGLGFADKPAAAEQSLPEILQFFDIAERTPRSPYVVNYDEAWMITGPVSEYGKDAMVGENWKQLEGQIIFSYYKFNPGDTALQIQRALEPFAADKGYEIAFACVAEKDECFTQKSSAAGLAIGMLLDTPTNMPALDEKKMSLVRNYFMGNKARLFYLTKDLGSAQEYVQIVLADSPSTGVMAITKTVITGEIPDLSAANTMRDALSKGESVNLDNLLFDTNSAILLPASRDQMHEIAMMLRDDPKLKLQIIGHTDSDGGKAHNQDLSERRAAAVVEALVQGFDIEADRLTSAGRGMDEPVASNATSDGKAKNRRVELKLQ